MLGSASFRLVACLIASGLLVGPPAAVAQTVSSTTGAINGRVTDNTAAATHESGYIDPANPGRFMERMRRVDNAEKAREEGVAIAREMVERVSGMVQGVQLSAPFGRYQMAIDVAEAIPSR